MVDMDSAGRVLRLVERGVRNGMVIVPYEWRAAGRQPWQRRLTERIMAELGDEDPDEVRPWRHSRRG